MGRQSKGRVIVFGILGYSPLAGVAYQFLHYLTGLKRLGYSVWYVEESDWFYDPAAGEWVQDAAPALQAFVPILKEHGFGDAWAVRELFPGGKCHGVTEGQLSRIYREADAFLNVTGTQRLRDEHLGCPRRILVESDPFFSQARFANGDPDMVTLLSGHNYHFSFGENIGAADCTVPSTPFRWMPTRQPVLLENWEGQRGSPGDAGSKGAYSTITTWHTEIKNLVYQDQTYFWTKDREFKNFLNLPQQRPGPFRLAISNLQDDLAASLRAQGWEVENASQVSGSLPIYNRFIQNSRAEFTVARDQYVRPKTGWFSDRSACYLAAGKPVITQETGFSKFLPTGRGLFGFQTMSEVLAAVDAIESDYEGHCRAAREIAAEYFAAEKVLAALMQRAGL